MPDLGGWPIVVDVIRDVSNALHRSKRHVCQGLLGAVPGEGAMGERAMGGRETLGGSHVPACGSRDGPSLALANILACLRLPPRFRCHPTININIGIVTIAQYNI